MADMMNNTTLPVMMFGLGVAALLIISRTILAGWRDWIGLKRDEMVVGSANKSTLGGSADGADLSTIERIELADMRERLRKLEAIAAGVDL